MRQPIGTILAATLLIGGGHALAQDSDLAGVTMRVLDDLGDVDAVVLELDANRGEAEEGAESDGRDEAAAAEGQEGRPPAASAEGDRGDREALHDPDDDERSEGKLEDNDVEVTAAPPAP